MPVPTIRVLFTSFFIVNGDYTASVRESGDGKKESVMDCSAGRGRERILQRFDRTLVGIGMETGRLEVLFWRLIR